MNRAHEMWEVTWKVDGPDFTERTEDEANERTALAVVIPHVATCVKSDDGTTIDVHGRLVRRIWRCWHHSRPDDVDPAYFEPTEVRIPVDGTLDVTAIAKRHQLGALFRSIEADLDRAHRTNPYFAEPTLLPRPGRAGHPIEDYARLVDLYLKAHKTHKQRYMKALQEQLVGTHWQNTPAKTLRRQLERACVRPGGLDLLDRREIGQGKAGGTMTDKCRAIVDAMPKASA